MAAVQVKDFNEMWFGYMTSIRSRLKVLDGLLFADNHDSLLLLNSHLDVESRVALSVGANESKILNDPCGKADGRNILQTACSVSRTV